jgi:hypothetical protein
MRRILAWLDARLPRWAGPPVGIAILIGLYLLFELAIKLFLIIVDEFDITPGPIFAIIAVPCCFVLILWVNYWMDKK